MRIKFKRGTHAPTWLTGSKGPQQLKLLGPEEKFDTKLEGGTRNGGTFRKYIPMRKKIVSHGLKSRCQDQLTDAEWPRVSAKKKKALLVLAFDGAER